METQKTKGARLIFCTVKLFVKRIALFFVSITLLLGLMYWWYKNEDPFQVCNTHRYFANTRIAFNRDLSRDLNP